MNKKSSLILGIFDLYYVWHYFKLIPGLIKNLASYSPYLTGGIDNNTLLFFSVIVSSIIQIIFILSLIVSGILYLFNKKAAYIMYFPQFVLRFFYVMPTFGIILRVCKMDYGTILYKVLLIFCTFMEFGRLFVTIKCLIKENRLTR